MRIAWLLGVLGCVDERGPIDVAARIDVSTRDHASVEAHCFDATPCEGTTIDVTIEGVTTRIAGTRGDVVIPSGAREIRLAWSDGIETVSAITPIPEPITIVAPLADSIVKRSGSLEVAWSVAQGATFEVATTASCDGVGRGITLRVAPEHPPPTSARIDLGYFDVLPPHDCFATLAVANLVEVMGSAERTRLFLRTQDVDQIAYTLAYRLE